MSQPQPSIRLVVFDLGRVLLRIADDWRHAAKLAGLPLPAALAGDISSAAQRQQHPQHETLFADFERGRIDTDAFFDRTAPLLGVPHDHATRLLDGWLIEPMPGAVALLDDLRDAGVTTACLSNTNAAHWVHLTNPGHPAGLPIDRLDHVFASQLIGHAKPDPNAYRHVEQAAGTAPQHILFFDDLAENVDAARQRGWHAELIPRMQHPVPLLREHLARYGVW